MPFIIERTLNVPVRIWYLDINLVFGVLACSWQFNYELKMFNYLSTYANS